MTDDILATMRRQSRDHRMKTPQPVDPAVSRRNRNNRKRGGAWEREVAHMLSEIYPDARKTGPLGGKDDVTAGPLFVQCKAVASLYPKRLDALLAEVEARTDADTIPVLALKHPGHERRRKLAVVDLRDLVTLLRRHR